MMDAPNNEQAGAPLSKLTAASLEDIKYIVDPASVSEPHGIQEPTNAAALTRTNMWYTLCHRAGAT